MSRAAFIVLLLVLTTASGRAAEPEAAIPDDGLLLGGSYPIEYSVSFHNGLLHWLDSLAMLNRGGATAGKTVAAHRAQYEKLLGLPSGGDRGMLQRYRSARLAWIEATDPAQRNRLTIAFFEAADLDQALASASKMLDGVSARALEASMRHFATRYRRIWRDGRVPREFLERVLRSGRREELARFLADVAGFFGVSPAKKPHPHLVLVPVPDGYGTHAQAIGPYLLMEIRPGEGLGDEIGPIVHENAHLLIQRMPPGRLESLGRTALDAQPWGSDAWEALREALPTAIAQGLAHHTLQPDSWSMKSDWYHVESIDQYAKRIFPLVKRALAGDGSFDEAFVKQLVEAYR